MTLFSLDFYNTDDYNENEKYMIEDGYHQYDLVKNSIVITNCDFYAAIINLDKKFIYWAEEDDELFYITGRTNFDAVDAVYNQIKNLNEKDSYKEIDIKKVEGNKEIVVLKCNNNTQCLEDMFLLIENIKKIIKDF